MASPVYVDGNVSLVLINTRDLAPGQDAVVILTSVPYPGRVVTIRDSVGYLSSPQKIIVSTQQGVKFADGTTEIYIAEAYGYLTVSSRDATSWNIKNTFGFPLNQMVANTLSLTTDWVVTSNLYAHDYVSTPYLNVDALTVNSSIAVYGQTFVSSIVVGDPTITSNIVLNNPGYSLYVDGSLYITSNIDVAGAAEYSGSLLSHNDLYVGGNVSTLGYMVSQGDITTGGNFISLNGGATVQSLNVATTSFLGGPVNIVGPLVITTDLAVQNSISTTNYTTNALQVISSISFNEKYITYQPEGLLFSDTITVPGISTMDLTASNSVQTSNLTVYTSIIADQATSLLLSSTAITNPEGSLLISSIFANTATFSNLISSVQLETSSLLTSTIYFSGDINAAPGGYMNINTVVTSTMITEFLYANTLQAPLFSTTNLTVDRLIVNNSFVADNVYRFEAQNVNINNTGGSIFTGSLYTQDLLATSTITNTSGVYDTNSGIMSIQASNVIMDAIQTSSITASTIATTSITATQLTIGAAPLVGVNGPTFVSDDVLYPSTNVIVSGGPGDYLTPFTVSNVKPPGIGPGDGYEVNMSFALNFNGPVLPGYYATVMGMTLYPNGELNSVLTLTTNNDAGFITTLYGINNTNENYATPPNTGGIPLPDGPSPASFLRITGVMYGDSAFTFQFQSRSNDNFSSIDPNASITMNNGLIQWPYYLNGTTIQNSLNDMSVRNIFYYGGLNFASDPALKEGIESADLARCSQAIQSLPLRRYKYTDAYLSTFSCNDVHRLGFLATELEQIFPKSVSYTEIPALHSTFRVIDTQQIEMAHLGATQDLMQRVATLQSTVQGLKNMPR